MDGAHRSTLFKWEVGKENIMVDVPSNPCRIMIQGGGSNRLSKLIEELLSTTALSKNKFKQGETCPVCEDTANQPYHLACGHVYCYGCLRQFLLTTSSTKQFPLLYMGDWGKCGIPIPLPAIKWLLLPVQFKQLLGVSFQRYLAQHPNNFRYCPTLDCPKIYPLGFKSGNWISQCQFCLATICVPCGENHDWFSCKEWKRYQDLEA